MSEKAPNPLKVKYFERQIIDSLTGKSPELTNNPSERLDFTGISLTIVIFDNTTGEDREHFINAMGGILDKANQPIDILAQIVDLAGPLNVTQISPQIEKLAQNPIAQ